MRVTTLFLSTGVGTINIAVQERAQDIAATMRNNALDDDICLLRSPTGDDVHVPMRTLRAVMFMVEQDANVVDSRIQIAGALPT